MEPVCAVVIGATPAFALTTSNGWTIALTPAGRRGWPTPTRRRSVTGRRIQAGHAAPFETMTGALTALRTATRPGSALTFGMQPGGTGTAMQEYQELVAKMGDPAAVREDVREGRAAFEKKMEEVGDRMTREMEAMTANPAVMQEQQARFGCGSITVTVAGGQVSGNVACGQKVGSLAPDRFARVARLID